MAIVDMPRRETSTTMRRKGMASLFNFSKNSNSSSFMSISRLPPPTPSHPLSESMMEENIENANTMITKWDLNGSSYVKFTSLFQESRREAREFIKTVKDLRRAMHFLVSERVSSDKLILSQHLMQMAMKRLQREFYQLLSGNRQHLDPESVSSRSSLMSVSLSSNSDDEYHLGSDDEVCEEAGGDPERLSLIAMSDLRLIADCMTSSGYGAECVKIYKVIRKSVIDEGLYRLGIERYSYSHINKMNPDAFEHHVKTWLDSVKAVKTLFHGERFLCDHVFAASDMIRESCFSDTAKEGAMNFFKFPEFVAKSKRSPEKIFRLMDLYESISELWPDIELIFDYESLSQIKVQALLSLHKLSESVQATLSDFESSIQKNSSKTPVPGGGIHPLTSSVMTYISLLANYSGNLTDILGDSPAPGQSPLLESNPDDSPMPAVTVRLAWTVLVLLCKLDSKAQAYQDVALSYLFLANNLHFVLEKVRTTNLKYILGDDWVTKHEQKVRAYALNYEAMAWLKVLSCLPENIGEEMEMEMEVVKGCFRHFSATFDEVYRKHTSWVVTDGKLRDEIKVSIANKLVPAYREFCDAYLGSLSGERNLGALVRYAPDDLGNYLSDLFHGTAVSGSSSSSSSSSSRASRCFP